MLLTFFVLLQGLSTVNEDQWSAIFNRKKFFTVSRAFEDSKLAGKDKVTIEKGEFDELKALKFAQGKIKALSKTIKKNITRAGLKYYVTAVPAQDRMSVEIKINSSVLFKSGQGHMNSSALMIIDKLSRELCKHDGIQIRIEGHTDNVPINTVAYPSNWELSAIRATSVLRRMIDNCVAPSQVTATGYGDRVPVADNDTAQSRAENRRIVIRLEY